MKVKEAILQEIENYIDGRIDELSELAKKYAEIDNYVEITRLKEMKRVQKMMEHSGITVRWSTLLYADRL